MVFKGRSIFAARRSRAGSQTDDCDLSGCINGDVEAQEAFVVQFSALVHWAVKQTLIEKKVSFRTSDIDGLHNAVFADLFNRKCRKLRQYTGKNGCSLSSWIRLITVRAVLDHLRKTKRKTLESPERILSFDTLFNVKSESPTPLEMIEIKEQKNRISEGIKLLRPRERLFLKLHFFKGLSLEETADILGLTKNNAYSVKHRAIQQLKAILLKKGAGFSP